MTCKQNEDKKKALVPSVSKSTWLLREAVRGSKSVFAFPKRRKQKIVIRQKQQQPKCVRKKTKFSVETPHDFLEIVRYEIEFVNTLQLEMPLSFQFFN